MRFRTFTEFSGSDHSVSIILSLLLALLLTPLATLHAADFVVVAPDVPVAPIIVFPDAPPRTRDAAVTLAEYIEKLSGCRPAVIDGEPKPLPERAIWVGVQPVLKSLFPNTGLDFTHPEENTHRYRRQAPDHCGPRPLGPGAHGGEGAAWP